MRVTMVLLLAMGPGRADLFVSPQGSDRNPGTEAAPFATLERARDAVRTMKPRPAGGVRVWIRGGLYLRNSTFALTSEDSGTEDAPVYYTAWPGERPRFLGGRRIQGFAPAGDAGGRIDATAAPHVLKADLRAQGITDFGRMTNRGFGRAIRPAGLELFFQGKPMTLARWPNLGWAFIDAVPAGKDGGKFSYSGDRPRRWLAAPDAWVHGYWTWDWADSYEKVTAIEAGRREISTQAPHGVYGYTAGRRFRALNLLEELDEPGEWYLDRASGILYFWPPEPVTDATEVLVSLLESPLFSLQDASHIRIEGLTLEATRGSGIEIRGGSRVLVAGCKLRNIGSLGVRIEGATASGVMSSDIFGTGDGGIILTGGDRAGLRPAGLFSYSNHFRDFSRWVRTYRPAVIVEGVGNLVLHNLMHDSPHMAIGWSGNEHRIEYNDAHTVCMHTADAGAFYAGRDWTWRGTVVAHNFLHNLGLGDVNGVYLDDWLSGHTVYGNLFHRAGRAVLVGGGRDNVIENNLMVDCRLGVHLDARGLTWAKNYFDGTTNTLFERLAAVPYKQPPWSDRYPELLTLLEDEPALPKYNRIQRNVHIGGQWLNLLKPVPPEMVAVEDNLTGVDPLFVDRAHNDLRLRPDSPAWKTGFREIPLSAIGLEKDDYRESLPRVEVVHARLEVVAPPTAGAPARARVVVENLGRVPAAGEIRLWRYPEEAARVSGKLPFAYQLDPGEQTAAEYTIELLDGAREIVAGIQRQDEVMAPMGTRITLK